MGALKSYQFWIDRGGTFTDVVARAADGTITTKKLLSDNPEHYRDAAVQGIREVLGIGRNDPIPAAAIEAVKMGTTVATNALLERTGEPTLLAITKGFKDALRIGYQTRPKLFALNIQLPDVIYRSVIEIDERVDAHGKILTPLDEQTARTALQAAYESGLRAVAIVLMHGYRFTAHERRLKAIAREIGFTQISTSHEVSPLMKLVGRGDTTTVDAYLSPILRRYVDTVAADLGPAKLMFMQSNGGLTDAHLFQGKDSILSGPAGGVVGMVRSAQMAGFERVIGFDMGGTSTDVCHFAGEYERTFESVVAGVRMRAPMMRIHTVAAGGGSILHFDKARFRVGPDSAGADPGPACYRRGGPLTVTDCNVMLGRIQPNHFPHVFGPHANEALDADVVRARFADLADEIMQETGVPRTAEDVADGFLTIAVENMANAIKQISVQRGYDVTRYVLNAFGGAAGQHACKVADALGMTQVLIHPLAGVLSAYGMGLADVRELREHAIEAVLDDSLTNELDRTLTELGREAAAHLHAQGIGEQSVTLLRRVHLRYEGTDTALIVPHGTQDVMRAAFEDAHRQRFGFTMPDKAVIVEAVGVEAIGGGEAAAECSTDQPAHSKGITPIDHADVWIDGGRSAVPLFDRADFAAGDAIDGPAIVIEANATTVVEPGWRAEMTPLGHLLLSRRTIKKRGLAAGTEVDPVVLEIFNNLFMSVAEQMGAVLANTAQSINIKERLDFSCAVFDRTGGLVANAPHVPVHLGSMSESVAAILHARGNTMKRGDVFVLNAPYSGGTHLPDVTVITPVFDDSGHDLLFFVGSRGHHADIGGITPGSMPPHSRTIEEEGVLIDNVLLIEGGRMREAEIRNLLTSGPYPARNPDQNLADLRAQVAANEKGVRELQRMVDAYGIDVVNAYMGHVQDNAEAHVRDVIEVLRDGVFEYEMDTGAMVRVAIRIDKSARAATVDFTGTSPVQVTNFNAPPAVTKAAVLYVFRALVDDDIPLNAGCLKPLTIVIPDGCMLNPTYPAAVVAGNVETSQAITNALFGALGVLAASQGTMNNFTFGDERYQYYETICGGAGAGPSFDGTDAIHTHMTNTRLTDPEVLEWRFPVLLEDFSIRAESGGAGKFRGGNGVIRRLRFLKGMTAAIVSGHRRIPPFGLNGGQPGQCGRNTIIRADGRIDVLNGTDESVMAPGDVFMIETPGGGGFNSPD
ncbi:MAG: hydantoinase B/oxoprolinase family protein [Hyphomicrobiales bacterium]|nr:hydantoinase B/oxoprolinase family protein [Hyphomicrobiales bacterium]